MKPSYPTQVAVTMLPVLTGCFAFILPISPTWSSWLLGTAFLVSLFVPTEHTWQRLLQRSWDLYLYFLLLIIGLIYTTDVSSGLHAIEKSLSLIILPWLILKTGEQQMDRLKDLFVFGVLTSSLICILRATIMFSETGWASFYYQNFSETVGLQPTYMAYYVSFAITFLLGRIFYSGARGWYIPGIVFLSCVLMLTAGRTTFVGILFVFAFFTLKLLFEPRPMKMKLQGLSVALLLLVIVAFQSPYSQRILPRLLAGTQTFEKLRGDSWSRIELWRSAWEANTSWFTGVGTGDDTMVMNAYFTAHNHPEFAEANFNAHNQYIHSYLCLGIPGLLAFLIVVGRPLSMAAARYHMTGILIFFPFVMYGLTEVFLGRYQGIVFFVLIHQIFISDFYKSEASTSGLS